MSPEEYSHLRMENVQYQNQNRRKIYNIKIKIKDILDKMNKKSNINKHRTNIDN